MPLASRKCTRREHDRQHHEEGIRHIRARLPIQQVYETNIHCVSIFDLDLTSCARSQILERHWPWIGHEVSPHKGRYQAWDERDHSECTNKCINGAASLCHVSPKRYQRETIFCTTHKEDIRHLRQESPFRNAPASVMDKCVSQMYDRL